MLAALLTAALLGAVPLAQAQPAQGSHVRVEIVQTNAVPDATYAVGDRLSFAYRVTNLSDRARSTSLVTSNLTGDAPCRWTSHASGTTLECSTGYHVVTQQDIDAGTFTPTATWRIHTGTGYPGGLEDVSVTGTPIGLNENLRVSIVHTNPTPDGTYAVGDRLSFTYRVTNLTDRARSTSLVTSNLTGDSSCRWTSHGAGNTMECAAPHHVVTQQDIDSGTFTPTATWRIHTGTGYPGGLDDVAVTGAPVTIGTDTFSVARAVHVNPQDTYAVGDRLEFSFRVENVTDHPVTVVPVSGNLQRLLPPDAPNCRYINLAAGAGYTCTSAYHVVTQADLDAGAFRPVTTWEARRGGVDGPVLQTTQVLSNAVALPTVAGAPAPDYDAELSGQPFYTEVQLATNGQGGFPNYRIPALTVTNDGDLLASYDGRPTAADAPAPNYILQRRSTDNGETWEEQTVIRAGKTSAPIEGYSDPSYIVDRETGHIFNFHVFSMDQGFWGSQPGTDPTNRDIQHANVSTSTDGGHTWTHRTITADITNDPTWNSRFATSGQGIQLKYGEYAGRLVQQYPVRVGDVTQAVSVYSDDNGQTWQAGEPVGTAMDENKTVELSDGRVMLNTRDQAGRGYRRVAISEDGGETYGPVTTDYELPDPTNNAAIIRAFPNAPQGSAEAKVLLFSNAASTSGRVNGVIRMSCDDGETWPVSKVFQPGGMAYSTLVTQADGSIGLLYEPGGGGAGIRYANFNLAWLGDSCLS